MKRYGNLKQLAEKLHRVQEGKNPTHEEFCYYTSGFAYFDKRLDEIENAVKEKVKKQRYMWQTLEDANCVDSVVGGKDAN